MNDDTDDDDADNAETKRQYDAARDALQAAYSLAIEEHKRAETVLALAKLPADMRDLLLPESPEDGTLVRRKLASVYNWDVDYKWTDLGKRVRALWLAEKGAS